jgi:hypothetical protein
MTNFVRSADIEKERVAITAFLSRYLSPTANEARYEWLYRKNPGGKALAWLGLDAATGQVIGVAAAFPRRIHYVGEEVLGYVLGDFCIHPDFRSLGPAMALQKRCLKDLAEGDAVFVFDFPSTSMLAIYKRLRMETQETMIRFAKPLRADRLIHQRISSKIAARGLSAIANIGLRLRDVGLRHSKAWTIAEETSPYGEEFTQVTRLWTPRMGVCGVRTAEYLNWRYLQHPRQRYHLWTARRGAKLCGFLIYSLVGQDAFIVDLLAEEDAAIKALLVETVANMRRHGVTTVSAPFLPTHPGRELLEACGFQPREASPVVLLTFPGKSEGQRMKTASQWYLTHGDRES